MNSICLPLFDAQRLTVILVSFPLFVSIMFVIFYFLHLFWFLLPSLLHFVGSSHSPQHTYYIQSFSENETPFPYLISRLFFSHLQAGFRAVLLVFFYFLMLNRIVIFLERLKVKEFRFRPEQ